MSARGPSPHATGYEDAITRRIAGLEARVAELESELARERAQAQNLLADNARLRGRAAEAERTLEAARRMRVWTLLLAVASAVLALGVAAVSLLPALRP